MNPCILVIEELPAIQEIMVGALRQAGYLATGTKDAGEALSFIQTLHPDLVVMDEILTDPTDKSLVDMVRAVIKTRSLPILILGNPSIPERMGSNRHATFRLDKPFSPNELIASVDNMLNRHRESRFGETFRIGTLSLNPITHRVSSGNAPIHLKPIEFRLLALFMAHPERVFGRAQLLDEVWGNQTFIDERAVDVQIRRLRAALTPHGHEACIETVRGAGYRLVSTGSALAPPLHTLLSGTASQGTAPILFNRS